jgi:3-deoxy-7-phosphoheptulonate synthase
MTKIISAEELINLITLDNKLAKNIDIWKKTTKNIIYKNDNRILTVVGPCSIHNPSEALEYAKKLKELIKKYDNLFIVMRVYFEKPRTTIWWKWLINDPDLDWSFNIEKWLKVARELLLKITKMWIPVSTEFLDPISHQYIWDLITWWAIWARTTESQVHRELASWLSSIIWFKNWTYWDIQIAIDAILSADKTHRFLWVSKSWNISTIKTKWNKNTHIILRWWKNWTNYDIKSIEDTNKKLKNSNIETWIMIDASHANSNKNFKNQSLVINYISKYIANWNKDIIWVMIESNINESNQSFTPWIDNPNDLKEWISITDACISLDETDKILNILNKAVNIRKDI